MGLRPGGSDQFNYAANARASRWVRRRAGYRTIQVMLSPMGIFVESAAFASCAGLSRMKDTPSSSVRHRRLQRSAAFSSPLQLRSHPRSESCTGGCHPRHFWTSCSTQRRSCPCLETASQTCSHSQQNHPPSSSPVMTPSRPFAWRDESAYNAPQPLHTGFGLKACIQRLRWLSWYV